MKMVITKMVALSAASALFLTLAGCNTVKGVGKDVEKVGEKTQEVAKDASDSLKKDKK